ncbi:MAG: hypothetical protein U0R81_13725 [Mycobacterium sp.]
MAVESKNVETTGLITGVIPARRTGAGPPGPRPDRAARDCPTERAPTVCAGGTEAAETAAGAGLGSTLSRSARGSPDLAGRRSPSRPSVDGRVAAAAGCVAPPEVLLGDFSRTVDRVAGAVRLLPADPVDTDESSDEVGAALAVPAA